jgi:ubiquinone/menaquinone biosynthesis C-methylase UbiE
MGGVTAGRRYVPAASLDALLPLYDPIMRLLRFSDALQPLIDQAQLAPGHLILDVGCGTGTLALLIAAANPHVRIAAIDPDPRALERAWRKARRAGAPVSFARAFGDSLPYADATFDRVFSSMMFHHVPRAEKPKVLAEIRRVLKPAGRLEFLDFAGGTHSLLAHVLHGRQASASADARLVQRMGEAGFVEARRVATRSTIAGAIAFYQARV